MNDQKKLSIFAQGERELVMTRSFDAPRELVFDAWTRPELLPRWLGIFRGWTMPICQVDLRVGGSCRFVWRNPDGQEMGLSGVYREILRPERLVFTERFDDAWYDGDALNTLTFVEQRGLTLLTATTLFDSAKIRDAVLSSPMEQGVAAGYDVLEALLSTPVATTSA